VDAPKLESSERGFSSYFKWILLAAIVGGVVYFFRDNFVPANPSDFSAFIENSLSKSKSLAPEIKNLQDVTSAALDSVASSSKGLLSDTIATRDIAGSLSSETKNIAEATKALQEGFSEIGSRLDSLDYKKDIAIRGIKGLTLIFKALNSSDSVKSSLVAKGVKFVESCVDADKG
jgi:cytoskeletal protein RodZ